MKSDFESILEIEISRFAKEASKHKNQWRRGQTTTIILITLSSIFSTASVSFSYYSILLSLLSAACSASTIAITSWLEMRKSFEIWKTETNILHNLYDIKRHIKFEKINNTWSKKSELEAMNSVEKIIRSGKMEWKNIQSK